MLSGKRIEQLILTWTGGGIEALVVTESPSGARQREHWPALAPDPETAVDRIVRRMALRGDVDGLTRHVRVRVARGGDLVDRQDLAQRLRDRWATEG